MLKKEDYKNYLLKTYSAWLGKNIGIRLGAPVEGWSEEKIINTYNHKKGYLVDYDIFASDDDSNGPLFFVRPLLEKDEISAEDIGNAFLAYIKEYEGFFWWGGLGISSEHTAYENLKKGIKAPFSGSKETNGIEIAEQIGGQIFSDCWGYVSGYDPEIACKLAAMASSVTHDGLGIEGGKFVAVCICLAYTYKDSKKIILEALKYLNPELEYYKVVNIILDFYENNKDDHLKCLRFIKENYGYDKYPGVCHIIPNTCVMIMGMLYGQNDFEKTLTIINEAGWDTDCNAGNVGSIMGALVGIENIPTHFIEPINDVVNSSSAIGYLNIDNISASSKMFAKIAFKLQGIKIDDEEKFDLPYATRGFRSSSYLKTADNHLLIKDDIYNYAYYLGNDIYDSRYDPSFSSLLYPNDEVKFIFDKKYKTQIFVEDCKGNKEYSNIIYADNISYKIKLGKNKIIHKYGLINVDKELIKIKDYQLIHHSLIDIDFKDYEIDEYGPRYEGDYLSNLRSFVRHSGKFELNKEGLHFYSDEHGLYTTLCPNIIKKFRINFEGDNLIFYYYFKDCLNYEGIGIKDKQIVRVYKNEGNLKVEKISDFLNENGPFYVEGCLYNDIIETLINGKTFMVNLTNKGKSIIGFGSETSFDVCVKELYVESI